MQQLRERRRQAATGLQRGLRAALARRWFADLLAARRQALEQQVSALAASVFVRLFVVLL